MLPLLNSADCSFKSALTEVFPPRLLEFRLRHSEKLQEQVAERHETITASLVTQERKKKKFSSAFVLSGRETHTFPSKRIVTPLMLVFLLPFVLFLS